MDISRTSFALVFAVWAAGLGAAAQFAKVSVVFPQIAAIYPEAGRAIGFLLSLVGFVGIVLGVLAGLLVSQHRSKHVLCVALLVGASVSFYQATLPALPLFLLSRVIEGASHLAIVVAAPTLIAQLSTKQHRGFTMTLWSTFFSIAFAATAMLGVPLADSYGVGSLFAAHALYMILVAALLLTCLPAAKTDTARRVDFSIRTFAARHAKIYRSSTLAAPAVGWLCYAASFLALLTVLPGYLPAESRVFVASAMPLASTVTSMSLGILMLRSMPAYRCIQIGFGAAIAALLLMGLSGPSVNLCITLAAVLGLVQGASFALVPQLNADRESQALANGAMAQMGNLGTTLGPPIMITLSAQFDITGVMVFTIFLFLAGIAAHQLMQQRRNKGLTSVH